MKTSKTSTTSKAVGKPKKQTKATGNRKVGGSGSGRTEVPEAAPNNDASEIDRLGTMSVGELQNLYTNVIGQPTRCSRKGWLVEKIMEAAVPMDQEDLPDGGVSGTADGSPKIAAEDIKVVEADAKPMGSEHAEPLAATHAREIEDEIPSPGGIVPSVSESAPASASAPDSDPSSLTIAELQERYHDQFGRVTMSSNRRYLLNRMRAASATRPSDTPRQRHQKTGDDLMVLPLRMEADIVDQLDAAWRRVGLQSRMDLFRRSLSAYLASVGENAVAALLADKA